VNKENLLRGLRGQLKQLKARSTRPPPREYQQMIDKISDHLDDS